MHTFVYASGSRQSYFTRLNVRLDIEQLMCMHYYYKQEKKDIFKERNFYP